MWTCVSGVCSWVPTAQGPPDLSCAAAAFFGDSPCARVSTAGALLTAAAALLNGSFLAFARAPRICNGPVPAHVFNAWACAGAALSWAPFAWLVGPRCVGLLPVLSGALSAAATLGAFAAVRLLGLARAAALWCGAAALASAAAGALRAGNAGGSSPLATRPWLAAAGLACVAAGLAGAVACGRLQAEQEARAAAAAAAAAGAQGGGSGTNSRWARRRGGGGGGVILEDAAAEEAAAAAEAAAQAAAAAAAAAEQGGGGSHGNDGADSGGLMAPLLGDSLEASPEAAAAAAEASQEEASRRAAFRASHGAAMALVAGALAGLVLLPMDWARYECRGLPWLPGMAVGALAAGAALVWAMHALTTRKVPAALRPPLRAWPAAAAAPGLAAGAVWGGAAAAAVMAAQSLGLAAANAAMQAGLAVAGLWGVLRYGELRSLVPQLTYWLAATALLAGIALLAGVSIA